MKPFGKKFADAKISVIIAAYQVENYIDECLKSVVAQTFKDFEVLIVVGNSRDETLKRCRAWENKDRRMRVILQQGKGLGSARNQGIREAKADLIAFLDADDWWDPTMLEKLYTKQREKDYSLVICDRYNVYFNEDGTFREKEWLKEPAMEYDAESVKEEKSLLTDIEVSVNDKLYKKELFYEFDIWQPDCFGEDRAVIHYLIAKCQSIGKVPEPLYYYRAGRLGNSVGNPAVYKTTAECMEHIWNLFVKDGLEEKFKEQLDYIFMEIARIGMEGLSYPAIGKDFSRRKYKSEIQAFLFEHVSTHQPKVSIVMPSYNVGKFIEQCLESVMNQTLPDIEIIVVDKFSTDGTREYIEKCMECDARIKLLDDVKGSCGYAYNAGIDAARGEYIGFVETDDYVEPEMFATLYEEAKKHDLDYVKSNFIHFISDAEGNEISRYQKVLPGHLHWVYEGHIIDKHEMPELPIYDGQIWTGIYRKEYLTENNVRFNESKGPSFQDHGFQWQAIGNAVTGMYLDKYLYHYRKDNAAASMKNPKAMPIDLAELYYIREKIAPIVAEEPDWACAFYRKIVSIMHYRLAQYIMGGGEKNESIMECLAGFKALLEEGERQGFFDDHLLESCDLTDWKLLKASLDGYYSYMEIMAGSVKESLEEILAKAEKAKKIVIAGQGDNGILLYWILANHGLNGKIVTYADNHPREMGDGLGAFVNSISIETAAHRYRGATYFLCNRDWAPTIYRQLVDLRIPKENVCIYKNAFPGWAVGL